VTELFKHRWARACAAGAVLAGLMAAFLIAKAVATANICQGQPQPTCAETLPWYQTTLMSLFLLVTGGVIVAGIAVLLYCAVVGIGYGLHSLWHLIWHGPKPKVEEPPPPAEDPPVTSTGCGCKCPSRVQTPPATHPSCNDS
jgi:hypothetical protein